jgi:hypothetical protein
LIGMPGRSYRRIVVASSERMLFGAENGGRSFVV